MKKIIALMLALLMLFCFAGCKEEKSDSKYIKDKGSLIVGITDFEPMDYQVDGEWTGFDAELARLIGEKLGVEVKFQEIKWETKENELAGKTIDCIWNGLTWDEDRAKNMSMTDYYMLNRQVVVIKGENESKLNSLDALSKATIGAESGSAGEEFIQNKLKDAKYIEKDAQIDALTEVFSGTCDAAVIDYTMAYYLINKEGSNFSKLKILDGIIDVEDEYYSVAFRKGSDITEEVNKYLKELKEDGTVEKLADKYGLKDAIVK